MKTALVTTTINVPHALQLYRACSPGREVLTQSFAPALGQKLQDDGWRPRWEDGIPFFVAGDKKTPEDAINFCVYDVPNTRYLFEQDQEQYACSKLLGWNTIGRRSIAILEALKWGAEIIVTVDDDNAPMSPDYFDRFEMVLGAPFSGLAVTFEDHQWWDVGQLLIPRAPHRGFPYLGHDHSIGFSHVVDAKIGVAAGICLGDPDISAVERIANQPTVLGVAEPLRAGVAVHPSTHTVFNSQNTAFLRELAPCFLMVPQFGRYDDIFASLIAQRVMREMNLHVHFGQPFVWQQRNPHNLIKDLKAELFGMEHILEFSDWLDDMDLGHAPVANMVRLIYGRMAQLNWMPSGVSELGKAWCDDCEKVMA